jgi:hypothetical protein
MAPLPPPPSTSTSANSLSVPPGLTVEEVRAAILEGLASRRLSVVDQSEGRISAYYAHGNITLALAISYQADLVTIDVRQWDSRPKGVKTQERWLANVRKDIMNALVKRKAFR